jgi:hypothetical protein
MVAQCSTLDRLRLLEEKERQEKLNEKAQWRQFPAISKPQTTGSVRLPLFDGPACSYRWPSWEFDHSDNRWKTFRKCGHSIHMDGVADEYIAVSCLTLKVSLQHGIGLQPYWSDPRFPANQGEKEMLAALCDTIGKQEKK